MKSISLEDLLRSGNISRRTYNILFKARLRTLFDLRKYKSGLKRLFSPQSPSLTEVYNLVEKAGNMEYLPNISGRLFMDPIIEKSKGEQLIDSLGEKELHLLGLVYDNQLLKLFSSRQRAHTVIANALSQVPVAHFLRDFLYEDDDRIMILYKVGRTSVEHFARVKEVMLREVETIKEHPEQVDYRIFLQSTQGTFDDDAFIARFYEGHQRLPWLYILQQFIIRNKSRAEMRAFLNRYDIFEGRVELDTTPIDRSSYTIATYSNTIFDALFLADAGWEPLDKYAQTVFGHLNGGESLPHYLDGDFVGESDPKIVELIADEQLLLSPACVLGLLGKLLSKDFVALGGYPRSLLTAKSDRWSHIYLIRRQLDGKFGFRNLLTDFRDNVYAKSEDSTFVDLGEFILRHHPQMEDVDLLEWVTGVLRALVVGELALETDDQGRVAVPRKVERSLADRLYLILEANGQNPMALSKLTEIINSGDGRKYVKATVSLALNKDPRFVNNGKKGLYALTEWQLPYFGSNIDIIYKVLSQSDCPMESDEILDVLNQYPYNESLGKNELSSVISIAKDKFRKFGFGYYGLADREYDPATIRPVRNNFDVDLQTYRDFVETNHRLPLTKNSNEEKRLSYWFSRMKKNFQSNSNWSEAKRKAFSEIIELQEKYQSAEPESKEVIIAAPEEPVAKPEEPVAKPEDLASAPEESIAVPEAPADALEEPVEAQEESIASPEASAAVAEESFAIPEEPVEAQEESTASPEESVEAPEESLEAPEESLEALEESIATAEESLEALEESIATADEPVEALEESIATADEPVEALEESIATADEPVEVLEESIASPEEPVEALEDSCEEDDEVLAAISPEVVAEPPVALFALEEESPFIVPDSPELPPEDLYLSEQPDGDFIPVKSESSDSSEYSEYSDSSEFSEYSEYSDSSDSSDSSESSEYSEYSEYSDTPESSDSPATPEIPEDWLLRIEEVREFVQRQHREPLALFTEEYQLAQWLAEQKAEWHAARLSPAQEECMVAIRDLLW